MQENPLDELIKYLDIAGKSITMYSESHPSAQHALQQAFQIIDEFLQQKPVLALGVLGADLLLDGNPVKRTTLVDRFRALLESRGVRSASFSRGVGRQQLTSLLNLINQQPARIREQGGIEKVVDDHHLTGISVNKLRYGIIGQGQTVVDAEPGQEQANTDASAMMHQAPSPRAPVSAEEMIASVPDQLSQLLSVARFDEADKLSKKVITAIGATQPSVRSAVVKILPAIVPSLIQHERWKNIELSLGLLLKNHFRKEQDPDTVNNFIEYFLFSIRRNLENRNFSSCNDIFSTLDLRPDCTDKIEARFSVEIESLWPILERDLRDSTDGTQTAFTFVKRCGSAGVNYLLDWLSEEQDQRVRSKILNYVEAMNHSQVAPELEKRLADDRWYVVRNMVTLLTRIKANQKLPYIQRALQNHDPRIAKEALKFLMGEVSRDHIPLLQALLQHPDKNIRALALRAVPRFGADNVRSTLHTMASNDPVSELRTLAGSLLK